MLTKNFYKLLMVNTEYKIRAYSPSSNTSIPSPFIDLINPSGKYICYFGPERADADKYERVDLPGYSLYNNGRDIYALGVAGSNDTNEKVNVSSANNTKTAVHNVSTFTSSKNVNEQTSTQESYPDGNGSLIMYIGNGTTNSTKDDYTMESCLTAYDRIGMITSQNAEAGLVTISYSVRPTEDIQLSEIGIFATKNSNGSNMTMAPYKDTLMVCHDVFTPVTLQANKTTTITYTIDLSKLTAETTIE